MLSVKIIPTPSVNNECVETLSTEQATLTLTMVILLFHSPDLKTKFH